MSRRPAKAGATAGLIQALDTSASMIYRVRKQLVEEGFEAVLENHRKRRMTSPVAAIFDGERRTS